MTEATSYRLQLPVDPSALHRVAVDLFDARALEAARDVFRLLVVERTGDPEVWYWLGRCHLELEQYEQARCVFEAAARAGHSPLFRALARGVRGAEPC
jgi:tetratricopeptide (TPR) repeat protein